MKLEGLACLVKTLTEIEENEAKTQRKKPARKKHKAKEKREKEQERMRRAFNILLSPWVQSAFPILTRTMIH